MSAPSDVVIVGGGLAGAATALELARRGRTVTLVERGTFPRDKPCGEGLLPNGVEALARIGCADVLDAIGAPPFVGIRYCCAGIEALGSFEPSRPGRGVHRLHLDAAILARATQHPAVTLHHGTVTTAEPSADRVIVRCRGGEAIVGRVVVGADGPRSTVRRALGLDVGPPRRGRWALVGHYELPDDAPLPDRVTVHVCGGYELYVTPVGERLVGLAALVERASLPTDASDNATRLARLAASVSHTKALTVAGRVAGPTLACGPLRVRARAVVADRALLVGDAAGFVDAITGEGMSLALHTARLAADAIHAGIDRPDWLPDALDGYARARRRLVRDHTALTLGLVWLARHPWLARRAVGGLAAHPQVFGRLLAVNDGRRTLASVSPVDLLRLVVGGSALRARPE